MDPISIHEAHEMRKMLEPLFGTCVHSWVIKYASYEALGNLILNHPQGARTKPLLPRPHRFMTPFKWDHTPVRLALVRYLASDEGKQALIGMRSAGLQMRKAFEEARYAGY